MKTPTFWKKKGILSFLLYPFGFLYSLITKIRMSIVKGKKASVPVICVGNLTAGGTGKTPVCISLAKILQERGYNPFFISRGYGGELKNIIVDPKVNTAKQVGDEPLLLARQAPVSINSDRFQAAELAIENGADILIMDDGFQNPGLIKDISLIVVDGGFALGNKLPIPAGPLREEYHSGMKRADAVIIVGNDDYLFAQNVYKPVFHATVSTLEKNLKDEKIIAFAGIGRPEKFYNSLRSLEANLIKTFDFPDHHFYSDEELKNLIQLAEESCAKIYTTSKDFVKIPQSLQQNFNVLEIEVVWNEDKFLEDFIFEKISHL